MLLGSNGRRDAAVGREDASGATGESRFSTSGRRERRTTKDGLFPPQSKKVGSESMDTFYAKNRTLSELRVSSLAGDKIAAFCRGLLVSVVVRRKNRSKRSTNEDDGRFVQRTYGHYGHQSNNYAHYGHETVTSGKVGQDGIQKQALRQYQIDQRGTGQGTDKFLLPGEPSISGPGTSGQFSLESTHGGSYRLEQPFGLTAGNSYQGGVETRGQFGVGPGTKYPVGPPISGIGYPQIPGVVPSVPGIPSVSSIPGIPGVVTGHLGLPGFVPGQSGISGVSIPSVPSIPGIPGVVTGHPGLLGVVPGQSGISGVSIPSVPSISGIPGVVTGRPGLPGVVTGHPSIPGIAPGQPGVVSGFPSVPGVQEMHLVSGDGRGGAASQTQVQVGAEGNSAQAASAGHLNSLNSQTQVQGSHAGNGSFSAQAQSGFTGGNTQSQVRGNKQGSAAGSGAIVDTVGSAHSQVQMAQPSGSSSGSAQGRFRSGSLQVLTQGGKETGNAASQAISIGLSSSQSQVQVSGKEVTSRDGFQGGASASARGGDSGGQAQSQLQGAYTSGRTYTATGQSGIGSSVLQLGISIPGRPGIPSQPGTGIARPITPGISAPQPGTHVPGIPSQPGISIGRPSVPGTSVQQPSYPSIPKQPSVPVGQPEIQIPGYPSIPGQPIPPVSQPGIQIPGYPSIPGQPIPPVSQPGIQIPGFPSIPSISQPGVPIPGYPSVPGQPTPPVLQPGIQIPGFPDIPSQPFPPALQPGIPSQPGTQIPGYPSIPGQVDRPIPEIQIPGYPSIPGQPLPPVSQPGIQIPGFPSIPILPGIDSQRPVVPDVPQPGFPSWPGVLVTPRPSCCDPKPIVSEDSTDCCDRKKWKKYRPSCCKDIIDDFDEDEDEDCRIVKATCYIVYKSAGRARICRPLQTDGC
ncbi:collagen alpha-5(IV) chain-like isoform X2 [Centruroides sculpturatus]|uniref:collagen alpha-5(IV) chain-like isoform X2 n=1 Tax=Centruroides sculpturatus TaxID=218467 RepID=UPI000C6EEA55|nr:collagen alpha-5(IV) chain-like isoform X2 [Centruroides sculpturatus]